MKVSRVLFLSPGATNEMCLKKCDLIQKATYLPSWVGKLLLCYNSLLYSGMD